MSRKTSRGRKVAGTKKRRPLDRAAMIHAALFASLLALMKAARERGEPLPFAEACKVFSAAAADLRGQLNRYEELPHDLVPLLASANAQATAANEATWSPLFQKAQQVSTEKALHELLIQEGQIPPGKTLSALKVFLRTRTGEDD